MSHPDPLYPCEDFDMDYNYDDHDAFYGEDSASYHPDADHEVESQFDDHDDDFDDSMDGDHESGLASAGWGTDEDYGYYGDYNEDY
jgi:hypothetical protein